MFSKTSHYVDRGYPHLTEQPLYVSQHFPLCWSRSTPSYRATSVCFPTRSIMWSRLSPSYTATFVCFRTLAIMLIEVIPILHSNFCLLSNTSHYVGRGYPHLTQQPLCVSHHFPLCWLRLSPSYRAFSVCFPTLPIMLAKVIPILQFYLCMFPNTSHYVGRSYPPLTEQPLYVCNTSHYVGRGGPHITERSMYVFQHSPVGRDYPNLTQQSPCASQHSPLCWSRLSQSYSAASVYFPTLPIMLVEVIPILHSNLCVLPNTSHHVDRGYPHPTEQPLCASQHFQLCWSWLSPSYRATPLCFPTLPIMLVEVISILQSSLRLFPNTSHYVGRGYPHLTEQPLFVSQHSPLCWSRLSPTFRANIVIRMNFSRFVRQPKSESADQHMQKTGLLMTRHI